MALAFGQMAFQLHGQVMYAYSKEAANKPGTFYHNVRFGVVGNHYDVHFKACTPELVAALKPYEGRPVLVGGEPVVEQGRGEGSRASLQIGGVITVYALDAQGQTKLVHGVAAAGHDSAEQAKKRFG